MKNEMNPKTLQEAILYFADENRCREFVVRLRWPGGVVCPRCGSERVSFLGKYQRYQCGARHAKRQFSVKIGTIFEDSPIPLSKWLPAIWLLASAKNGISSYELARGLNVTQKSAWFMLHRIRLAMQQGVPGQFAGHVEADETFIGGKARYMHQGKRNAEGRGAVGKTVVMGLLERHGEGTSRVRAKVVSNTKRGTVQKEVREHVAPGSSVYTDALKSYDGLENQYLHQVVDHAERYANGQIHTNGLENFWSLLKRSIRGTYVSVEPFHLFRYIDEQAFRFNTRGQKDGSRFTDVIVALTGKRLTYKQLTGTIGYTQREDAVLPKVVN